MFFAIILLVHTILLPSTLLYQCATAKRPANQRKSQRVCFYLLNWTEKIIKLFSQPNLGSLAVVVVVEMEDLENRAVVENLRDPQNQEDHRNLPIPPKLQDLNLASRADLNALTSQTRWLLTQKGSVMWVWNYSCDSNDSSQKISVNWDCGKTQSKNNSPSKWHSHSTNWWC